MSKVITICSLMLLVVVTTGTGLAQTRRTTRYASTFTVPVGTVIPVTLDNALSSKTNQRGDRFSATVRSRTDGDADLPLGSKIEGVVIEVQRADNGQPGMIDLDPQDVLLPNGQKILTSGSLIALDEKNVTTGANGRLTAKSKKSNDRLKFIGIGAGGGLIIGMLTKNTLLGTLLGGVAGYLYSDSRKAKVGDVNISSGTEFGIRLDREVAFNPSSTYATARQNYRYAPPSAGIPASRDIAVTLDGQTVSFDNNPPITANGHVLVPLRPVMDQAQVPFNYDEQRKTVRVETDAGELYLKIGQPNAFLEGEKESLETPAQVRNGILFVPMHFLALATGSCVVWDAKNRTAVMTECSTPVVTPNRSDIHVTMDGRTISFGNNQPIAERGNVFVPLAPIMDEAQLGYYYNQQRQTVRLDNGELYLKIGQAYALLDGERQNLEAPAMVRDGKVLVPIRFLTLATGMRSVWNANARTVTMTTNSAVTTSR